MKLQTEDNTYNEKIVFSLEAIAASLEAINSTLEYIAANMQRAEEREIARGEEASKVAQRILNNNK